MQQNPLDSPSDACVCVYCVCARVCVLDELPGVL